MHVYVTTLAMACSARTIAGAGSRGAGRRRRAGAPGAGRQPGAGDPSAGSRRLGRDLGEEGVDLGHAGLHAFLDAHRNRLLHPFE
jgi:hypothetical protein